MADDMIHVQIWDAAGNLVTDEMCKAQTATQEQIDDMVAMIEGGAPAWIAAALATRT